MTPEDFLARQGWDNATREAVAGDAGGRRYFRVTRPGVSAILMDGSDDGPIEPFLAIDAWLREAGLHAPAILAASPPNRLALIEDLGADVVSTRPWPLADEEEIYRTAAEALVRMQEAPPPSGLPVMSSAALIEIVALFPEIELPGLSAAEREQFLAIWQKLLADIDLGEQAFLHRDYHSPNLVWLAHADGLDRLGILDFQDAFIGPPAYDLVSLLDDPRRDVHPLAAKAAIDRYLDCRSDLQRDRLERRLSILGAQRALRILAVFTRLSRRGKPHYLSMRPRVETYLRTRLRHPVMAELNLWLQRHTDLSI